MIKISYVTFLLFISDFNECDDKATHNCHIHATCINKPGSFECRCKEKYSGDGVKNCGEVETKFNGERDSSL